MSSKTHESSTHLSSIRWASSETEQLPGGLDILVHMEEIGRVIAVLECRQSRIGRRGVGFMDPLLPLLGKEVHVHPLGVWLECLPDLLRAGRAAPRATRRSTSTSRAGSSSG